MRRLLKHWKRIVAGLVLVPMALATVVMGWAFANYPATYVVRLVRYGDSDVWDYQKFPARVLEKSPKAFTFEAAGDEARVRELFTAHEQVDNLEAFLDETETQALLVIVDDKLMYEKYFHGCDRETIVTSFSTAKSFCSALVGAAIGDGYIESVDEAISVYLPELAERDARFEKITIRHLLTMSSGIRYEEFPFYHGDDAKTYYHPDLRAVALAETEIAEEPGKTFLYNNYHPLLLGLILERSTGRSVASYLEEKVWAQIGDGV